MHASEMSQSQSDNVNIGLVVLNVDFVMENISKDMDKQA